ncbi:MFS transporter [Chloroflexota bacterium]
MRDGITAKIPYKWIALVVASFGSFNVALDVYVINFSLPEFREVFGVNYEAVLWVYLVYPLLGSSLFLTWGRLGDRNGRKRLFVFGFLVYTIGLALCSMAPNFALLIVFRMVEVVGLTMLAALAPAIAIADFPDRERGKSLGIHLAIFASGAVIGPLFGGFIHEHFAWQAMFYLRLPIAIAGLTLVFTMLRRDPPADAEHGFDIRGAVILLMCLSCFIVAINQGRLMGWTSTLVLSTGIAALALFPLLLLVEKRAVRPVLDLMLFRNRTFATAILGTGLALMGVIALDVLMPFYITEGVGYSESVKAWVISSYIGVLAVMHPFSGWLGYRVGTLRICMMGLAVGSLGLFLVSGLSADANIPRIISRVVVYGFGVGLFFTPLSSAVMGSAPQDRLGAASAMLATARQISAAIGATVLMTLFASRKLVHVAQFTSEGIGGEVAESLGVVGGFHDAVLLAMSITILGLVFIFLMHRRAS